MAEKNIIVNLHGNTITEDGYAVGDTPIILKVSSIEFFKTEYEDGEISAVEGTRFKLSAFNPITGQQYNITMRAEQSDGSMIVNMGVPGV